MRRLLLLVGAIVFVDTMFYATITPLLPDFAERFDLSKTAAGVLTGSYAAGTLIGSLPGGWLAVRWGGRRTVVLGLALMGFASLGFAFGENVALLTATRFAQGVGGACSFAGALGWLLGRTPPGRRGAAIGSAMSAAVGGALFGPVLGALAREVGMEAPFGAIALVSAVLILAALRMPAPPRPDRDARIGLIDALATARVRGGMILVLAPALVFGTINVLAPLELDRLGASGFAIGATFLVAAAIETIAQSVVGRASDRHGRRPLLIAGLAGSIVCMPALTLPDAAWALAPIVVVTVVVVGSLYTPAMALLSDGAEAAGLDQGMAFALVNLTWAGGQVVGALAGSGLADVTSDAVPYLAWTAVFAAVLAMLVRRRATVAAAA